MSRGYLLTLIALAHFLQSEALREEFFIVLLQFFIGFAQILVLAEVVVTSFRWMGRD